MPKKMSASQPIKIPAIPPFKKRDNQHSNYPPHHLNASLSPQTTTTTSVSVTPPSNISEIPPFKSRKSSDYTDIQQQHRQEHRESQDSAVQEHQLTIGPTGGAEWMRRLKVAEQSPIHRSTDCIVSKDLGTSSDSELLKPAPSMLNMVMKAESATGTSVLKTLNIS